MALAYSLPGGGIVATCTRYTLHYADGGTERVDYGGKLVRTPTGWAAATGELVTMLTGLRILEESSGEDARVRIRTASDRFEASLPPDAGEKVPPTAFLALRLEGGDSGVEMIRQDGSGVGWEPGPRVLLSWPPAVQENPSLVDPLLRIDGQRVGPAAVLGRCRTPGAVIRMIACLFAYCAALDAEMAPEIEMGIVLGTRHGPQSLSTRTRARDLAALPDDRIFGAFAPPAPRPPLPLAPAEKFFGNLGRGGVMPTADLLFHLLGTDNEVAQCA